MLAPPLCTDCKLHQSRKNIVLFRGSPSARLMFIGEGPGMNEDLTGKPFVGDAGQLLDRMLIYMSLTEDNIYICNVVKCRPPGNRDPEPDEVEACLPYLQAQVELVQPELFVVMGKVAAVALGLLEKKDPLKKILGQWLTLYGRPALVIYHPAFLLRNAAKKHDQAVYLDMIVSHLQEQWLQ